MKHGIVRLVNVLVPTRLPVQMIRLIRVQRPVQVWQIVAQIKERGTVRVQVTNALDVERPVIGVILMRRWVLIGRRVLVRIKPSAELVKMMLIVRMPSSPIVILTLNNARDVGTTIQGAIITKVLPIRPIHVAWGSIAIMKAD